MCDKVTWCTDTNQHYGRCVRHSIKVGGQVSDRPWNYYKRERLFDGETQCDHCSIDYFKLHPKRKLRIVASLYHVDHIESSKKGTPEGEQPSNYQLLCSACHTLKSHDEKDYHAKKIRNEF